MVKSHTDRRTSSSKRNIMTPALVAAGVALCAARPAMAVITGPYSVDANTLQLWHMDGTTTNAVGTGAALNYLGGSPAATLNTTSFSGFGSALNVGTATGANGAYMGAGAPANQGTAGGSDNINIALQNPATRAFTMEAIVKLNSLTGTQTMDILSGEGEGAIFADRAFEFSILPIGDTSGVGDYGKVRVRYYTADSNPVDIALPTTGLNAVNTTDFFHVAVTNTGTFAPNNISFYWTRLDPAATTAALLGTGQGLNIRSGADTNGAPAGFTNTDFAIGNELRATNGQSSPFNGLIDEVRISSIARAPGDFLFSPPVATTHWNTDSSGLWTDTTWTGGVSPSGPGVSVGLGGGPVPQTANHTIAVSGTQTVGHLGFTAENGNVISLTQGTAGQLSLDNAGSSAQVYIYSGSPSIGVPVVSSASGAQITTFNANSTVTFTDALDATAGPITLSGPGTVQIGNGTTVGAIAGNVIVNTRLVYSRGDNTAIAAHLSGSGTVSISGASTTTFTGTNSFGMLEVSNGTVTQSQAAGLGSAALVVHSGTVDLNGFHHTANGLISATAETTGIVTDDSPGAGTTTLTLNPAAANLFAGKIQDGNNGKVVALTKAGAGTLTLTNSNAYTGLTTVLGGTLAFSAPNNPVLSGTIGADVQSGALAMGYTPGNSPQAMIEAMLIAGYNQSPKFSSGLIHASVLPPEHLLGWYDNTFSSTITVASTLPGDTNCDLVVNFDDLLPLAKRFRQLTGARWQDGDSNYDGAINFEDLLLLAQNYNHAVTGSFSSDWALAQSLVPEPTTFATALGVTCVFGSRRSRRSAM